MDLLLVICNDQVKENLSLMSWLSSSSSSSSGALSVISSSSSSSATPFLRFLQSKVLPNSSIIKLPADPIRNSGKVLWNFEDETEFSSFDQFNQWRIDFLQKILKHFPDFFGSLVGYLYPSSKLELRDRFIDLFCSSSYFLGINCLVELFLSCWPLLDDDSVIASVSSQWSDLPSQNKRDIEEECKRVEGRERKELRSTNYSKLSSFFFSFSSVSSSTPISLSNYSSNHHLLENLQSRYASLLSNLSSAGFSSPFLISKRHFQQQLVSAVSIGMLLKDQMKPVMFSSSVSSITSTSTNKESSFQFNLLSLITSCYQLDSNTIRKSLSISVQRCRWPFKVPSSSTSGFELSLSFRDIDSCSPFPWLIFQRMSSEKQQRSNSSSSCFENDEKTIESLLRKLSFLLIKHGSFSLVLEVVSVLTKKINRLFKTLNGILSQSVRKYQEEKQQQVHERKTSQLEKSLDEDTTRDSSVTNEELSFECNFIISCLNFLQNGIFGIMKYKLINTSTTEKVDKNHDTNHVKKAKSTACDFCHTSLSLSSLLRCSKCKSVYYCSKEHQLAGWQSHKVNRVFL
jgi:hypothetical protein